MTTSYQSFLFLVKELGISVSNLYDVKFLSFNNSNSALFKELKSLNSLNINYNPGQWLSFYTDEVVIPGSQVQTGDYIINSSPIMRYANTVLYPEVSITFIIDALSNQKKLFDKWVNFIKPMVTSAVTDSPTSSRFNRNRNLRVSYRDDYVCDIQIDKYERLGAVVDQFITVNTSKSVPNSNALFTEPIKRYTCVLKNAFPQTVSSVPLSSGSSQLNRVTVNFNYEYILYSDVNTINPEATVIENVNPSST